MEMHSGVAIADRMRRAIEGSDAGALKALYADDAVMEIIDRVNPPSHPKRLEGKDAIAAFYEDVCSRAMTHRVDDALADSDHIAFTEACEYPDGTRVFCSAMIRLKDGRILRQVNVQAWDEAG